MCPKGDRVKEVVMMRKGGIVCIHCILVLEACGDYPPCSVWQLVFGSFGITRERRYGYFDWGERGE